MIKRSPSYSRRQFIAKKRQQSHTTIVRKKSFPFGKTILFIFLLLGIVGIAVVVGSSLGRKLLTIGYQYVSTKTINLKKTDDAISVLILGIGGGTHDGPNLSDTNIYAYIDPAKNTVHMISIPRDLWIPDQRAKINTIYATGEEKGQGISYAKEAFSKIIGKKINYSVVVNFAAFTQLVDLLGGIDVKVAHTLDDYEYPVEGKENELCGHTEEELPTLATASSQLEAFPCRYEHVHFDQGTTRMDGKKALIFARSRHGIGSEGSDFARSQRQHLVISAVREKLLSLGTILNPVKMVNLYNVLKSNINTDVDTNEFDDFIRLAQKMKQATITNAVIDTGDQERLGLLINPPISIEYGGAWVLTPRVGKDDFSEIQKYIACITRGYECNVKEQGIEEIDPTKKPTPSISR